jgi:hypothetical protein
MYIRFIQRNIKPIYINTAKERKAAVQFSGESISLVFKIAIAREYL